MKESLSLYIDLEDLTLNELDDILETMGLMDCKSILHLHKKKKKIAEIISIKSEEEKL
jgi:hypothetical protein